MEIPPPTRREGFPNERLAILPLSTQRRSMRHPIAGSLYPTRAGFFPKARGHAVERPEPIRDHLLIQCVDGRGWCRIDGMAFNLEAGQATVLPAGRPHAYGARAREPWSICWVHFAGKLSLPYLAALGLTGDPPLLSLRHPDEAREPFEALYSRAPGPHRDGSLLDLHAKLTAYLNALAQGRRESIPRKRECAERINRVIAHLGENLHRMVRLEEMARIAHWTPNHCSTVFRAQVNESPAAFLLHLKLARSCEMLTTTDEPIARIAAALGFEDAYYFSRCFKRCYQVPPSEFRRQAANPAN